VFRRGDRGPPVPAMSGRRRAQPRRHHRAERQSPLDVVLLGGKRAVAEAVRSGRVRRVMAAKGSRETQGLRDLVRECRRAGVTVDWMDPSALDELGVEDHQGVAGAVRLPPELGEAELMSLPLVQDDVVVVLDGITDPQNLGACARAAEAAGAVALVQRNRRAAPMSVAALRASSGALLHLQLARVANLHRLLERMKNKGVTVVGLDGRADHTIHDADRPRGPVALVVGAEDAGLSRLVRESCDLLVSIPLRGRTRSLNASAALAVALFGYAYVPKAGVAQSGSASDL
jgi:23S rRNA (guanosine2251-2'-O)-methyltransferase